MTEEICEFCEIDGFGNHAPRCPVQLERELTLVTQERDVLRKKLDHAIGKDGMSEREIPVAITNARAWLFDWDSQNWYDQQENPYRNLLFSISIIRGLIAAYEGKEEGK